MSSSVDQKLKKNYETVFLPGSLSGFQQFFNVLKNRGIQVKKNQLKDWMHAQTAYTIHHPVRKHFQRNRVVSGGIDDIWQMDLVDMRNITRYNKKIKYLLTCIDIFSKFAWVEPIKTKNANDVLNAFKNILKSGRRPNKIQTDKGKEFLNKNLQSLLQKNDISFYTLNSEQKASIVERYNRTLKEKMYKYFSSKNTYTYIDILKDLVKGYNSSYHRSIKTSPENVNKKNENEISDILFPIKNEFINFKYKIGDTVRISKHKNIFEKGFTPNFTEEIFVIKKAIPRIPPVYILEDLNNETIEGVFYEKELIKSLNPDKIYRIDKIIRTKKNKLGEKEYFVSWLGYPKNFNSWIKESDIKK